MSRLQIIWILGALSLAFGGCTGGGTATLETDHGHEEDGHAESESSTIFLTAEAAKIAGIETQLVVERLLQQELKVPGTVTSSSKGRAIVTPPVGGQILKLSREAG